MDATTDPATANPASANPASADGAPAAPLQRIALVANRKSGTNARDKEALARAMEVFGPMARAYYWDTDDDVGVVVRDALAEGAQIVVAAGGDGTATAIASAMLGSGRAMSVLPLGTFNFFARGLRLPEEPAEAARAILEGSERAITIGTVNGKVFLNNASLGIYPAILREREAVYRRWGRRRIAAHWSVLKTFLRFQHPMRLRITADGAVSEHVTPLLFVARSAYQLDFFGLEGSEAIRDDQFAVLVGCRSSRWGLMRMAWRLATRRMREGQDYHLIHAREVTVETARKRMLVAFDGEKVRGRSPFRFEMHEDALRIHAPRKVAPQ